MRKPLTSLRAFVVLFVFITHLRFLYAGTPFLDVHETYMGNGDICVTFFFVLSGLVFSLGYGDRFTRLTLRDWAAFVWKRLKKLYPLYITTILIMVVWYAAHAPSAMDYLREQVRNLALAVTLTQTYNPTLGTSMVFNAAAWYLSTIFAIYLVVPLLLRLNHLVREDARASRAIVVLAVVAYAGIQATLVYGGFSELTRSELGYFHPAVRILQFIVGLMLGNLVFLAERGETRTSLKDTPRLATGLEAAALILWVAAFVLMPSVARALVPQDAPAGFEYVISYPVHLLVSAFLVWVFAQGAGAVSRLLSASPFVGLGSVSFGFFLIHWVVIHTFGEPFTGIMPGKRLVLIVVCMLVGSVALSFLWYRLDAAVRQCMKAQQNASE